ncbi:oxygenase MpaB family protein [Amycolatopsis sp. lyj-112]|uniref:oxygenase MpaB family protein n=1 Tax=Amycolatopsis sp. lyj-112 TaxID=2789288 RepID=UPI003978D367
MSEMFEPFLLASVNDTQGVMTRPALRYDRTLQYMAMIVFGDSESVLKAADILVKIHSRIVGTEPISGLPYNTNDPEAQLWIHLTAWHSADQAEEDQYWADCARAAEFQTIDIAQVPRSREEMRAYYERMRPILAVTETTQQHVDRLLDGVAVLLPECANHG